MRLEYACDRRMECALLITFSELWESPSSVTVVSRPEMDRCRPISQDLRLWHHRMSRSERPAMLAPDTSATRVLAEFAAGLSYDDLPEPVIGRLKQCILDALGCCLFGVTLPWTRMLIDLANEEGGHARSRVIGTPLKTSVSQAVLIGATAGHGFEMDDIHAAAHLHAGSLALPTALALADTLPMVSGRELIAAIAAGYEVGLRVGLAATGRLSSPAFPTCWKRPMAAFSAPIAASRSSPISPMASASVGKF